MYTPLISELKNRLSCLESRNLLDAWYVPNEQNTEQCRQVTFFITPIDQKTIQEIIDEFEMYENLRCVVNSDLGSSKLMYKMSFLRSIYV